MPQMTRRPVTAHGNKLGPTTAHELVGIAAAPKADKIPNATMNSPAPVSGQAMRIGEAP
jgi:hypothetical protein